MTADGRQEADTGGSSGTGRHLPSLAFVTAGTVLGCTLLATLVSPAFAWREHALSNLGVAWTDAGTQSTVVLFNGGLVTGSLVGVTFCALLYQRLCRRADRVVTALAGTALASMGLVGIFPQGTGPHFPVAIAFFLLVSVTLWTDGTLQYHRGERRWGGLLLAGGTANILLWAVWFAVVENHTEGIAMPELFGAAVFTGWLCASAVRRSGGRGTG